MSYRTDELVELIRARLAGFPEARLRDGISDEEFFGSASPLRYIEVTASAGPVTVWREAERLTWVSMPMDVDGRAFEASTEWHGSAASVVELVVALVTGRYDVVGGRVHVRTSGRDERLELWPV